MANPSQRFTVIDVFRGMTVFLMIVVNTQGSGAKPYAQMEHAEWNGFTLADLVFPSFLFAVGNAMSFVLGKMRQQPASQVLYKIFKRTFLLFLTGYLLTWYPFVGWNADGHVWLKPISETRILAVLQRIALAYCFAALLIYGLREKWLPVISVILLLLYWFLLYYFGDAGLQYTIEGNAVRKLDLFLLGEKHIYREKGIPFDPEGLLSTIPAIVNVLAGYITVQFIRKKGVTAACVLKLSVAAAILIVAGLLWNYIFPVNKKLWTGSYALYSTGWDIAIVSLLLYLTEIYHWKYGVHFFTVPGRNPLFIYVLSTMLGILFLIPAGNNEIFIDWINRVFYQRITPGPFGCLLFSLSYAMVCWCIGWVLDKHKIYIRL